MLNIKIQDQQNRVTPEMLSEALQEAAPVLLRAKAGEDRYADSQGWLNLDQWAGDAWLDQIEADRKSVV